MPSGRRVAVIGAGPAGLSAAWYLVERGHEVTIYDTNEKPGGSLRYSIPEFRLPEKVLDRELEPLWEAGVRFVDDTALGYEVTLEGLLDAGFDAVLVGIGAWQTREPQAARAAKPSSRASSCCARSARARRSRITDTVAVIGDGTAALRRGADRAPPGRQVGHRPRPARRRRTSRPAPATSPPPSRRASRSSSTSPPRRSSLGKTGRARGGRVRAPRPLQEPHARDARTRASRSPATTVISAVSYVPDLGDSSDEMTLSAWNTLEANYYTGRTRDAGVFAAGDAVTGARSVIHAVAAGKRSALAIDAWLRGTDLVELEEQLAVYAGQPYLEQLADAAKLGDAGRAPRRAQPGLAQDGHRRRAGEARHHAQDGQGAAHRRLRRGREGLLAGRRPRRGDALPAVRLPSHGACDLQKLGVEYA